MPQIDTTTCTDQWNDLGLATRPATLLTLLQQAGFANDQAQIESNLQNQNGTFDINGSALLTFKMANWLSALRSMHRLGQVNFSEVEEFVEYFLDRTDSALWASRPGDYQSLPLTGGNAPLVPYGQAAGFPLGWNLSTPWHGWSRIFTVNLSGTNTTFVRSEPLMDGIISYEILETINYAELHAPNELSAAKRLEWLDKIEPILDGWTANFEYGRTININPTCSPSTTGVALAGQFYLSSDTVGQTFADPIALNQGATILAAMLRMNQLDSNRCTDATNMAAAFIQDIDSHYFDGSGGWYYRLSCASFEPHEDLGHAYITASFLRVASERGLLQQPLLQKFIDGLRDNAYLGSGDFSWMNDGSLVTASQVLPNGQTAPAQGKASGPTDSAVGGNSQLGKTLALIATIPGGVQALSTEAGATAVRLEAQGSLNSNENIQGLAMLLEASCQNDCLDCSEFSGAVYIAQDCGIDVTTAVRLVTTGGQPISAVPQVLPAEYVVSLIQQGVDSELWDLTLNIPCTDAGQIAFTISDQTCTPCTFNVVAGGELECNDSDSSFLTVVGFDDDVEIVDGVVQGTGRIDLLSRGSERIDFTQWDAGTCSSRACSGGGHVAGIDWCNWSLDSTAQISATGVTLGDPLFLGEREDGLVVEFEDTFSYRIDVTNPRAVDSVIIPQHDFCKTGATVRVFVDGGLVDLKSHYSRAAVIEPSCNHCGVDNHCNWLVMDLAQRQTAARSVEIAIVAPGKHTLNRIAVTVFDEVGIEFGTNNPFNGTPYERKNQSNGYGWFPDTLKPRAMPTQLTFTKMPDDWYVYNWRKLRDYWMRYPIYISMSRRRYPGDIGMAKLGQIDGSTITSTQHQTITVPVEMRLV